MKILLTGSSGLVGLRLSSLLLAKEHQIVRLVRSTPQAANEVYWNPGNYELNASQIEGLDAVVHLAGENIADKRWSAKQKAKIRDSRVNGTKFLCDVISKLNNPPSVFISASAIGFYGNRGDEVLDKESSGGRGFLADLCREWEAATKILELKNIRVVNLRFGIILSTKGGALPKLLSPFRLGVGGILGSGKQYMSWIALDDAVGAIYHALVSDRVKGPINVVSPDPLTNGHFTKILTRVLCRPAIFPVPGFVLKIVLGEMADALLLSSSRVIPQKLIETGYQFQYYDLEKTLRHLLDKDTSF